MPQYALPLPHATHYTEENFLISPCNEAAWAMVHRWPHWTSHAMILSGIPGSGKSHLSHIWATKARATIFSAGSLPKEPEPGNWLVEDLETLADPRALLHLYNYTSETKGNLLITTTKPPSQLTIPLPDLSSRLLATPLATIEAADDAVLAAAMRKQFADRQLKVEEDVIAYVLPRIERSFTHIQNIVARIDETALQTHKNITVPFVRKLLESEEYRLL